MLNLGSMGRLLILGGVFLSLLGLLILFHQKIPFVGRLPGDIFLQRGSTTFYFPIVICLILSAALTFLVNLVIRLFGG
jgi:hypothetical protein